jgi:hypothetical protein
MRNISLQCVPNLYTNVKLLNTFNILSLDRYLSKNKPNVSQFAYVTPSKRYTIFLVEIYINATKLSPLSSFVVPSEQNSVSMPIIS